MSIRLAIKRLVAEWDQLLMLAAFAGLIGVSLDYAPTARQFPLVFLVAGFLFICVQVLSTLLPPRLSSRIEKITEGVTADIDLESIGADDSADNRTAVSNRFHRLIAILGILAVFLGTTMLFGFLIAVPVLVFATVGILGTKNYREAAITTGLLMGGIYCIFGILLNVPILEGTFFNLL